MGPQQIELPKEWKENPWIQECLDRMEQFSNDPLKVEQYEAVEKALLTYTTHLEWKLEEGLERGRFEGRLVGHKEGKEEGRLLGRKEGKEEGKEEGRLIGR